MSVVSEIAAFLREERALRNAKPMNTPDLFDAMIDRGEDLSSSTERPCKHGLAEAKDGLNREIVQPNNAPLAHFDGSDYKPEFDQKRLTGQAKRIYDLMKDGRWRTLFAIAQATGDPEASISAQLRHLRKPRFGSHTINKRNRGHGLFEYQLV